MVHDVRLRRPGHGSSEKPRYLVCGLGVMGGSLCYALQYFIPKCHVTGVEVDSERRNEAERLGIAGELLGDLDGLDPSDFDVVFVATPVSVIPRLVRTLAEQATAGALLTDLGSAKGRIQEQIGDLPEGVHFIGGHPMTGSALEGLEGADPHLYENAIYVLTPRPGEDPDALAALESVLERIGALVRRMDPTVHDESVSTISHLPYLLAVTLVETLLARHGATGGEAARIAAGGFHGATRVATCTPEVFRDILLANRSALRADLESFQELVASLARALEEEDGEELAARFRAARSFRRALPRLRKGVLPSLPEAIVKAKDQPGFIGAIATMIGAAQINIRDLAVLHSREGEGGTLRIVFETEEGRRRALRILDAAGFVASERDY